MNKDEFSPGEGFQIKEEWYRRASPVYKNVVVSGPGRLHFSVLDFSKMQPVTAGGGGIGTSVSSVTNELELAVGQSHTVAPTDSPTATHLLQLFKKLVQYERDDLSLSIIARISHSHAGFGSNVSMNTCLMWGLNVLFGIPFSVPEIFDILTMNFVEDTGDGRVYWGLDTGVGEAALLYGGLVWVDERARYVGNIGTDGLHVITATGDMSRLALSRGDADQIKSGGVGGAVEKDIVARECLIYQQHYGARLHDFLEQKLKPRLVEQDLEEFLAHGWELNTIGTFKMLQMLYDPQALLEFERVGREAGLLYCGISSAGPCVFGIASDEGRARQAMDILERKCGEVFGNFRIGTLGKKMAAQVDVTKI